MNMTRDKINLAIEKYVRENLSPKQEERDFISARYQELSKMLEGESFQSGSYARFTSITPIDDLDIIWVLPSRFLQVVEPEDINSVEIFKNLASALEHEYQQIRRTVRITPKSHSVGIYFGKSDDDFSIDVVPAIPAGEQNEFGDDIYYVPEIARLSKNKRPKKYSSGEGIEWIKSDPKGYIEFARDLNEQNEAFRKVAKFIRAWRKGCRKNFRDFPLKSFHLELIVAEIFSNNSDIGSYEVIKNIFENFEDYLTSPLFEDRADSSRYVDEYLNSLKNDEKQRVITFIKSAEIFLQMISNSKAEGEISYLLDRLFAGEEFIEAHDITMVINPSYIFKIDGLVREKAGFRSYWLKDKGGGVLKDMKIDFEVVKNNIPGRVGTKWKVRNTGREAKNARSLRGEITDTHTRRTPEETRYLGEHYVECYATVGNACVAKDIVLVNIVSEI